jgi:hypothetical protein
MMQYAKCHGNKTYYFALFLAGCSNDTEKAEDVPGGEDVTVNCTADPDGSVSKTLNTLAATTVDIGDVQDVNGELAWRSKNTIKVASDGDFSIIVGDYGPVTNYDQVLDSYRHWGDRSLTLVNEETDAVLSLKPEASPDLSTNAPVTFTYTC